MELSARKPSHAKARTGCVVAGLSASTPWADDEGPRAPKRSRIIEPQFQTAPTCIPTRAPGAVWLPLAA